MKLKTGHSGVVANVTTPAKLTANYTTKPAGGEGGDDKIKSARALTEAAQQEEDRLIMEAEQAQAREEAEGLTVEAKSRSEKADKLKMGTPAARKAHQTAAIAHTDAKTAWSKQSGNGTGNNLEGRAKAQRQVEIHTQQAERHKVMCKGLTTMSEQGERTGVKGAVVITNVTTNVWSDEAREAAIAARQARRHAFQESAEANAGTSRDAHANAAELHSEAATAHWIMASHAQEHGDSKRVAKYNKMADEHEKHEQEHRRVAESSRVRPRKQGKKK